ncbi:MarR family winged helix-turn-helix transcriptional regulator [Aquabacter spiritensis]|uniref:MarR family transcriptional regulator n=1 Tax=Aquabacter spiritensis TaxID=933073 RepID=A0A4R3LZF1_9HYPH|nr:MarR family transcriptional regulator [Aquabacter spiritensis]TCT06131.1 MarR family transcriptional regulator [Aquabacter spiritensis]
MAAKAKRKPEAQGAPGFDTDPLHRMTLGYLVNLIARLMAQSLKARNGADGILPGQYPVAVELLLQDGMSQRDLCEAVRIEQATMANTLKRMERDGLITRRQSTEDGRLSTVHLTELGICRAQAAVRNAAEVNRIALDGLSPADQAALRNTLIDLAARLEADLGEPAAETAEEIK